MPVRFRILGPDGAASGAGATPSLARLVDLAEGLPEIRLGRRIDLELPLPFATLSAVHARVGRDGDGLWLEDAGSTNGTALDGLRLDPGERRPLAPGAELRLGDVRLVFEGELPAADGAPAAEGTATIARRLVGDLLGSVRAGVPTLTVSRGAPPDRLALVELRRVYVVGRAEGCALPLDVEEVSREHAAFVRDDAGVVVRDLGSKNGVVVAGARVAGEQRLTDGDVVEIGPVALTLDDPVARYLRELSAAPEPLPVAPPVAPPAPGLPASEAPPPTAAHRSSSISRLSVAISVGVLALAIAAALAVAL